MSTAVAEVHSRRIRLLAQGGAIIGLGLLAGFLLEISGFLSTSALGRIAGRTGLPVIPLALGGVAVAVAVAWLRDSWRHRIILGADGLVIHDGLGDYRLPYANIAGVKAVPLGGVAVVLRDRQAWLDSIGANRDTRRKIADVVGRGYGGDILIRERDLHIGTTEFMAALEARRTKAPQGRA